MALRDYLCKKCGATTEILERKDAEICCAKCGSKDLDKILGKGNFVLKGGGWYKDGYSSKKGPI